MKSATSEDVRIARETGVLREDVMYKTVTGTLVHGKRASNGIISAIKHRYDDSFVIETAGGELWATSSEWISFPEKKGPATTPKKPRHKPTKGTKPFREVPYDAALS